jgi:PhoPQ-activated pathogenicity-related protein
MVLLSVIAAMAISPAPTELGTYLVAEKSGFAWSIAHQSAERTDLSMASGTWHGTNWHHSVVLVHPEHEDRRKTAILIITGGPTDERDVAEARDLARRSHLPVAVLFDIPNQPIEGRREDDLIAWSFQQYLSTGDATWPVLFPMVRATVRAMDTLVDATRKTPNPIRKFVVTGASKRGWTTWLTGALKDRRVVGIAPVVFDFLNFPAQLKHQNELWGKPSERMSDYTEKGLDQIVSTPEGQRLVRMMDPYSYRANFKVPTLIVVGANDPYWATDAQSLYYKDLPQTKSLLVLPNEGHTFNDKEAYLATLAAFGRACSGAYSWKKASTLAGALTNWSASADSLDFRPAKWERNAPDPHRPSATFTSSARVFMEHDVANTITTCTPVSIRRN